MNTSINNNFSLARIILYIKKYGAENRNSLAMSGLFVTVMMIIISVVNGFAYMYSDNQRGGVAAELGFMTVAFIISGCFVASVSFRSLWDVRSAVGELMFPVSSLEKFLTRWVYITPGFIAWTLLSAIAADIIKVAVANIIFGGKMIMAPWAELLTASSQEYGGLMYTVILIAIGIQSFYFLGSVLWKKHCFIKTFWSLGVIFIVYLITVNVIVESYSAQHHIRIDSADIFDFLPGWLFVWLIVAVNYVLTYMRLKESEVIHRW